MIIEIIKIKFYQNVATTFYGVVERKSSLLTVNKAKKIQGLCILVALINQNVNISK